MINLHRSLSARLGTGYCTRRTFLLSALLSLTAGSIGNNRYSLADSGAESCLEPLWLRKIITDRQAAARLGRAYLDTRPAYRHCPALITDIEQTLKTEGASISAMSHAEQTASVLQAVLSKEYRNDEVVSVAGWVLSETEARLYALVYLATTTESFSEQDNG
jgi:hypothetical protein